MNGDGTWYSASEEIEAGPVDFDLLRSRAEKIEVAPEIAERVDLRIRRLERAVRRL